jgi:hypothetical protein
MCHKQIVWRDSILMSSVRSDICELCGHRSTAQRPPAVPGIIFYFYPLSSGLRHLRQGLRPTIQISRAAHKTSRRRRRIKNVSLSLCRSQARAPAENSQTKLIKGQGPALLNKITDKGISRRAGKLQSSADKKSQAGSAHATYKSPEDAIL